MPEEPAVTTEEPRTDVCAENAQAPAEESALPAEEGPPTAKEEGPRDLTEAAPAAAAEESTAAPIEESTAAPTEESTTAPTEESTTAPTEESTPEEKPEDRLKKARKEFSRLGLATSAVLGLGLLGQVLASWLVPARLQGESWYLWAVTFAPLYLVSFPVGFAMMRRVPAHRVRGDGLTAKGFLRLIPICICMMLLGNYIGLGVNWLVSRLPSASAGNPVAAYAAQDSLMLKLLFLVVLAPLAEELLFRRALIDRMRPYGERLAVVTTSLMFALFHGNFSQFFYAFTLGLVFGYLYMRTGRLRWSLLLHMFINLLGSVAGPFLVEKAGTAAGQGASAFSPWTAAYALYTAALLLLGITGLVLLLSRRQELRFEAQDRELPRGRRFRTVWLNPGMGLLAVMCLAIFCLYIFVS